MGDRASISFKKGKEESVVLCSHWGGKGFFSAAQKYARTLKAERKGSMNPLDRFEPHTVMVDFIRWYTQREFGSRRVESDLYVAKSTNEVDNSDNGHLVIDFDNDELF